MPEKSITVGPDGWRPNAIGREDFLRLESARLGSWMAVAWRRVLLSVILLEIPLQIDKYYLHDKEEAALGAISGFNFSLTTICLGFLYLQWLPRLLVESRQIRISTTLLAYIALSVISILWAADKQLTLYQLFLMGQGFLIYTYVVNTVTTRSEVIWLVKLLMVGLFVQGFFMVLTRYLKADLIFGPFGFEMLVGKNRVIGSLGSPNVAGSYLALMLPIGLGLLLTRPSKRLFWFTSLAMMLGGAALILTMSRGGWVAAGFAFVVCFVAAYRRNWLSFRAVAWIGTGLVILAIAFQSLLVTRIFGEDNGSAESRFPLYYISTLMIADHPLGVGSNNWEISARSYAETSDLREEWYYTVHNKYLLVCAEIGILGLAAYLAFLFATIRKGWRAWQQNDRLFAPLALGCTTAIAGQMIHMNFDVFNSRIQMQELWLVAALVVAIAAIQNKTSSAGQTAHQHDHTGESDST